MPAQCSTLCGLQLYGPLGGGGHIVRSGGSGKNLVSICLLYQFGHLPLCDADFSYVRVGRKVIAPHFEKTCFYKMDLDISHIPTPTCI